MWIEGAGLRRDGDAAIVEGDGAILVEANRLDIVGGGPIIVALAAPGDAAIVEAAVTVPTSQRHAADGPAGPCHDWTGHESGC
jgi:hypothetical protein